MYGLPGRRHVWDTGELDLWKRYGRLRKILIKADAHEDLEVLPYFDDKEKPVLRAIVEPEAGTKIYEIKCGREYHGTISRIVTSSEGDFLPYWMDLLYQPVDDVSEKVHKVRIAP